MTPATLNLLARADRLALRGSKLLAILRRYARTTEPRP